VIHFFPIAVSRCMIDTELTLVVDGQLSLDNPALAQVRPGRDADG